MLRSPAGILFVGAVVDEVCVCVCQKAQVSKCLWACHTFHNIFALFLVEHPKCVCARPSRVRAFLIQHPAGTHTTLSIYSFLWFYFFFFSTHRFVSVDEEGALKIFTRLRVYSKDSSHLFFDSYRVYMLILKVEWYFEYFNGNFLIFW